MTLMLIKYQSQKKESYGTKNSFKFIEYNVDDVIRPLCMKLPQIIRYVKFFDSKLLKKHTKIWERVSSLKNIKFNSEPVYGDNDKCIKTKTKLYGDKISTNFQSKKVPKENASYQCLSLIMLDSVIRVKKSVILKHYWKNSNMN